MNFKISARLIFGFTAMALILAVAVGLTIWNVTQIDRTTNRIVQLRMPVSQASTQLVSHINASLAALRGYMLTGNTSFKDTRANIWDDISDISGEMDKYAQQFTNQDNVKTWNELKALLAEFKAAQMTVENIAHTPDEQPALQILNTQAAPHASKMVDNITNMINLELAGKGGTSGDRVQILGMMADVRGSLALSLANIRAYLLTGDTAYADAYAKLWSTNEKRFSDLTAFASLLSADQSTELSNFSDVRKEFSSLPAKMFEIRASNKTNMANYLLVTEAAPRAGRILNILLGEVNADGKRSGGMAGNQKLLLTNDAHDNSKAISTLLTVEWILLGVGLTVAGLVAFLIIRSIVGPVRDMTRSMGSLADGDLETTIPALDKHDEIGEMAQAVQVFKDNAIRVKKMEEEQKQAELRAEQEKRALMLKMANDFESSIGSVVESVSSASTEMQASAASLSATAEQTSKQSTTVAAAAEEASTNVQTVASAAEELSSSIAEISRQVAQSTDVASAAVAEVTNANRKVQGLATAAQKIGDVVALITDIADQTNLLALNATIEAARAGEAGKGFAVVAAEVKNLANQTAKATEEISSQISGIQGATDEAVLAIQSIGGTINTMNEITSTIAAAVEEQGAATQEIARNVEQAATGTNEVSSNIAGVNAAANETGASSEELLTAAQELSRQSEVLREEVNVFLDNIRQG
jgi:methyl-accepting chemotaxis protein